MKNLRRTTKDSLRKKGHPKTTHDPQDQADAKELARVSIVKNTATANKHIHKAH